MSTDQPPEPAAGEQPDDDDVTIRIEELTGEFLRELQRGHSPSIERIVAAHPDLAPHLESRLRLCRTIFIVTRKTPVGDTDGQTIGSDGFSPNTQAHPFAFRIRCPHCGHQVQVIDDRAGEVTCHSCGSSVKVSDRPSPPKFTAPPMPEMLGHFTVLRALGEGGFGIVYLGHDTKLDRLVALKVPRNGFFSSIDDEQRFFREAKHVAQLKHAHIAQVYEISDDRSTPFIASEFIEGLTLRDHAKNQTLSFKEMVELMIQVAEAVDFAHRHKIIHRDLKTSNILVGPNQHAYVVDFGLSRRDDVEMTITIDGALIGTLQYMSPEQVSGQTPAAGPLSDVYALGVILYELLCHELPFHGTKRMLIDQVIHDEPRAPRRLNENVPKDLETIALKAMAKKAGQRYASAQSMADDLKRWLNHEPIHARPVSPLAHAWSWCLRHPTVSLLSSAIVALLLLTTGLSIGWGWDQWRLTQNEKRARDQSEYREGELLTLNGVHAMERNDLAQSAFWLSEALVNRDTPANRTRLGLIQDRLPKLTQIWGTGANVDLIAFDGEGKRVSTASFDGRVQVFDLSAKQRVFDEKITKLSHVELSPNGEQLVVYGHENHAQLWQVPRRQPVRLLAHTQVVVSARFHADGQSIATGGFDGFARIWNANDGQLKAEHKFDGMQVIHVEFVPGTTQAIVVTRPTEELVNKLSIWDYANDRIDVDGLEHDSHIIALKLFSDERQLNCVTRSGKIHRWQLPSGQAIGEPLALPTTPNLVMLEAPNRALAITDTLNAQAWDLAAGQPVGLPIRGHANAAAVATDAAHSMLALGGNDGWIGVYWQSNGLPVCGGLRGGEHVSQLRFHPDSRRLVVGGRDGVLHVWDLAASAPTAHTLQHRAAVRGAHYSRDGSRCLTDDVSGKGYVWNTANGQLLSDNMNHDGPILDSLLSADGKVFVTASADKTVRLWNALDGSALGQPLVHEEVVTNVALNSKGDLLLTGCKDGTVSFWTIGSVDPPQQTVVGKHGGYVVDLAFSPDGSVAISISEYGEMFAWDPAARQPKFGRFPDNPPLVYCDFMPDGRTAFTCDAKNAAQLWNLAEQRVTDVLPCIGAVNMALAYEQGQRMITCETSGAVRLWRKRDDKFKLMEVVQNPAIQSMRWAAINERQNQLAVVGGTLDFAKQQAPSGACLLWDLAEHRPLSPPLQHLGLVRRVSFHPQDRQLLTASSDKTARLWSLISNDLPTADAIRIARLIAQVERDEAGRTNHMSAEQQVREFADLQQLYPRFFAVDAEDQRLWQVEVELHKVKSNE